MNPRYKRNINKEKRSMFNNIKASRNVFHTLRYTTSNINKNFIFLLNKIKNN